MNADDTMKAKSLYFSGYTSFNNGDFQGAIGLATQCLEKAPAGSYWYAGALGLRQAVNLCLRRFHGENVSLEAESAAQNGVSRAFLSLILLDT